MSWYVIFDVCKIVICLIGTTLASQQFLGNLTLGKFTVAVVWMCMHCLCLNLMCKLARKACVRAFGKDKLVTRIMSVLTVLVFIYTALVLISVFGFGIYSMWFTTA